ncbi:hypothetical protein [Kocuria rosea]|uniref:hypothetical protein n=1 Tax=Kocuria rosea TaxID=1275 RepID=UPI0011A52810|nr:hypothetical protein [Kocuria rosea]
MRSDTPYYTSPNDHDYYQSRHDPGEGNRGMSRFDGLGFPLHGSTAPEPWPHSGRLMKALNPGDEDRHLARYPSWADHQRIERRAGKATRYVCHPYVLSTEAFHDFIRLREAGWRVWVTGKSVYYPGGTIRVEIWWPKGGDDPELGL